MRELGRTRLILLGAIVALTAVAGVLRYTDTGLVVLIFAEPLTFVLDPVYIGALFLTAIALWQVTGDGRAVAFEGYSLIALFGILAAITWYQ